MENSAHHYLRINGERFPLPEALHGDQHIVTAVTRGPEHEYIGVAIEGVRFDFKHSAMQLLLRQLSSPGQNGEGPSPIVQQAFESLQRHFENEV